MTGRRAAHEEDQRLPELSCGVDLVEIASFGRYIEVGGERFLRRIYTKRELDDCGGRLSRLAARFAAKEAIAKALGTGIRGISWTEMEVRNDPRGRPLIHLRGRAAKRAAKMRLSQWSISISHSEMFALAFVVAFVTSDQEQTKLARRLSSLEQVTGLFPGIASIFETRLLALGDAMDHGGEAAQGDGIEDELPEGPARRAGDTASGRSSR